MNENPPEPPLVPPFVQKKKGCKVNATYVEPSVKP